MSTPLENMSIEQKLQTMELLWDDLRANAGDALSPPWHGGDLAYREAALARSDESIEDWAAARRHIRDATR